MTRELDQRRMQWSADDLILNRPAVAVASGIPGCICSLYRPGVIEMRPQVPMVLALSVLFGLNRLHRAIWVNHRYRFTTWRWGKVAAGLMLIGLVLKLAMGH